MSLGIAFFLILYIVVRCYKENGVVSDDPLKTMVVLGSGSCDELCITQVVTPPK